MVGVVSCCLDLEDKDTLAGAAAYTRSIRIEGIGRGGKEREETLEIRSLNNARAVRGRKGKGCRSGLQAPTYYPRRVSTMTTPPNDTTLKLKLPEGAVFEDLKLRRCAQDAIDLDMDLVERICKLNDWDFAKVQENPGPVVSTILSVWYKQHLAEGGSPDMLMEALKQAPMRH